MISFGPFQFDPAQRTLLRDGVRVPLTRKGVELLGTLIESDGRVVAKESLIQQVWPDTFVSDGSLTFQINQLRQALGDSAKDPKYIHTVPGVGYRFVRPAVPDLTVPVESPPVVVPPEAPAPESGGRRVRIWHTAVFAAVALLAVGAAAVALRFANPRPLHVARVTQLTHDGSVKSYMKAFDGTRILVMGPHAQQLFDLERRRFVDNPLAAYQVLDVSTVRGEALAMRREDPGARRGLWSVRLDGTRERRIGMVQTRDSAVWSHDGTHIAFHDGHNLQITDAIGGAVKTIATFTGIIDWIRWAPDDTTLRMTVGNASNRTVRTNLYEVRTDGGSSPVLLPATPAPVNCCGSWLASGSDYVFESNTESFHELWTMTPRRHWMTRRFELHRLSSVADGLQYTTAVPAADGHRIYALGSATPRLYVYDEHRREFALYLGGIDAFSVRFSPDGQSVVYINRKDFTVWRARADGSDPRQLTFAPWHVDGVTWSPDGHQLAIWAQENEQRQSKIHLLSPDGGTPRPVDPRDIAQGIASWSPEGDRLVFGDVPETWGDADGSEGLHIIDLRTGQTEDIPGSAGFWSSRWSPDGKYIAATRIADRGVMLYTIATREWRDLHVKNVDDMVWTADSRYLYCDPEGPGRWARKVRIPDGNVEKILDFSEENIAHTGAGLSADGRPLFLRGTSDLYMLELARR